MESNKINEMFDNKYIMYFDEAIVLIKTYFSEKMQMFTLIDEYKESTGYWGIKYSYNGIIIFISCGRGYLENEITIDGKEFFLLEFEPIMENIKIASEKNIIFTLDVIKRFFESLHDKG